MRIHKLPRFAADERPFPPDDTQRAPIRSRCDFIRAVSGDDHAPIAEFEIRHERGIDLFDRRGVSRQAMRRGANNQPRPAWCRLLWGSVNRSGPCRTSPHASLALIAPEKFKSRDIMKSRLRGNLRDPFTLQRHHQRAMPGRDFAEKACCLLPLAVAADVGVVAAPNAKMPSRCVLFW